METVMVGSLAAAVVAVVAVVLAVRQRSRLRHRHSALRVEYGPVGALKDEVAALGAQYAGLRSDYQERLQALKTCEGVIANYQTGVGTMDISAYEPLYPTPDLAVLEAELEAVKEQAKVLVKNKRACESKLPDNLVLNGRKGAAKTFVSREIRLRIRCLDNEVKAAIAMVDWNNISRLLARVEQKWTDINAASQLVKIFLTREYLAVRLRELRLSYEIKQLKADIKEEEREERQRLREEQRDEERLKAELARVERARSRMEQLVEQELARIDRATEAQRVTLALHQKELALLRAKEGRALSMAQQTRRGYVYVISNELSFGPGVCKIGMTRRLDPNDRVKELGDASVPDVFTVHAFIYTEDAPALEKYLHERLSEWRVNLVNRRKEFFRVDVPTALALLDTYTGEYVVERHG